MDETLDKNVDPRTAAAVVADLREWMLSLSNDDLRHLGVDFSVEEPVRLVNAYARYRGLPQGSLR